MSRDKLTLSEMLQENIHLDEQLTDAQHTIGMQVETIVSLQAEIERLNTTINDASLGIEFTLQQRFSGNLDEWDQATRTQLTNIMNGLDEAFDQ